MNTKLEIIRSELLLKLKNFKDSNDPENLKMSSKLVTDALNDLQNMAKNEPFANIKDEIAYFKEIRPEVLALKIDFALRYNLLLNKPIGTIDYQVNYFEEILLSLQKFLQLNGFYYQYYKNVGVELDHLYFVRNPQTLKVPSEEIAEPGSIELSPASDLFARFIAYESAQRFIISQLNLLTKDKNVNIIPAVFSDELKWTGEVINLVEVAYGFWLTGQINSGNASLSQIIRWLEKNLEVNMGIVQKRFSDISRRKRLSITKYIDQMKSSIIAKIESSEDN